MAKECVWRLRYSPPTGSEFSWLKIGPRGGKLWRKERDAAFLPLEAILPVLAKYSGVLNRFHVVAKDGTLIPARMIIP